MKLKKIVKLVGSQLIQTFVPGGDLLIKSINAVLPADKQLGPTATGLDLEDLINGLPAEAQVSIREKRIDFQIENTKQEGLTRRALFDAEANSKHSTRPHIALGTFYVLATISLLIVFGWMYAIINYKHSIVVNIQEGWPWILALIAPFAAVLRLYFGDLRVEHRNRLDAAQGIPPRGGVLQALKEAREQIFPRKK